MWGAGASGDPRSQARGGCGLSPRQHGPQPVAPPRSPAGLGLAGEFRELTTRRSQWEGEGFVFGLGGWGVGERVCEKLRDLQKEVGREELGLRRRRMAERSKVTPGKPLRRERSRGPAGKEGPARKFAPTWVGDSSVGSRSSSPAW